MKYYVNGKKFNYPELAKAYAKEKHTAVMVRLKDFEKVESANNRPIYLAYGCVKKGDIPKIDVIGVYRDYDAAKNDPNTMYISTWY